MKRVISFVLSLVMVVGICTTMPFTKIEASAIEASDIFKVTASDFENNKITYTVHIKKDKSLLGAILYVEYDPNVLALDENDTGACSTTDGNGDECYSVSGVYEQGFMSSYDNQYAIAHVYGTESDYKAGSSDKPYMQFTFEVTDENRPETNVAIYCYELKSRSNPDNNIPNGSNSLICSDTRTTLGKVAISSVEAEKNGVRIKWEKLTGADGYKVYKNNAMIYEVADNNATEYLDTDVNNNNTYSYTVRAVNETSGDSAPLSDAASIKYLAAPSNVVLSTVCNKVVVEWQALDGASLYQVCRRTVNADGSVSDWVAFDKASDTKYADETVADGTKYEYAVRAWSEDDSSVLSDVAEITYIAGAHSFGDWAIASEPTCTAEGSKTKTCSLCGYIITEAIGTVEHTYSTEWTVDVAPTCVSTGSKSHHCLNCDSKTDVTVVPATGHTASDWIVDEESTCESEGIEHKVCTSCEIVLETREISKKEHSWSGWKTEKKATVNSAGLKYRGCTECGEVLETAKIPQLKCSKPKLSKIENTTSGVKITWGKVSGADKYDVYRKTGSKGKYSKIGTTSKTYYTDKKASSGKKYYYYVKAVNEAGSSSASSSLSKYYLADTTLSTPKSTKSGITLKWKKITGADGYMVYRKTGSGSYSKIATVKGNSKVTYTDKSAKKGKKYTYKIKAYKSKTYSAYSNTKTITDKY